MPPPERYPPAGGSSPPPFRRLLPGLVLVFLNASACPPADPYQAALMERQSFLVELHSWAPGPGRILLEMDVQGQPRDLSRLTVLVTQYDGAEEPLRKDRVPIDLEPLRATGGMQALASVPAAARPPVSLSVEVEVEPPPGAIGEFPELRSLAGEG